MASKGSWHTHANSALSHDPGTNDHVPACASDPGTRRAVSEGAAPFLSQAGQLSGRPLHNGSTFRDHMGYLLGAVGVRT